MDLDGKRERGNTAEEDEDEDEDEEEERSEQTEVGFGLRRPVSSLISSLAFSPSLIPSPFLPLFPLFRRSFASSRSELPEKIKI